MADELHRYLDLEGLQHFLDKIKEAYANNGKSPEDQPKEESQEK